MKKELKQDRGNTKKSLWELGPKSLGCPPIPLVEWYETNNCKLLT